jgi:hypothetical protein
MTKLVLILLMLPLAACTEANPSPATSTNQMIESPLQNTVTSSFDSYPPRPVGDPIVTSTIGK